MTVKNADVLRAARLAKLKIDDEDVAIFGARVSKVLEWVEQLQEVDVTGVKPMVSPVEDDHVHAKPALRQDIKTAGDEVKNILKNAPAADFNMFKVPKVIE